MHKLIFSMQLRATEDLIYGNLQLIYPGARAIDYIATSGCTNWQQSEDVWARGRGPIPAGEYQVSNEPYWLETRGVEGLFYHITPDPVGSGDRVRGELGLHFDANVPGSSGCIVLRNESGWKRLCDRLASIPQKFIPLSVEYA
ncbi:MAG: hypothetical protein WBL95_04000 [Microcoleus sp.]